MSTNSDRYCQLRCKYLKYCLYRRSTQDPSSSRAPSARPGRRSGGLVARCRIPRDGARSGPVRRVRSHEPLLPALPARDGDAQEAPARAPGRQQVRLRVRRVRHRGRRQDGQRSDRVPRHAQAGRSRPAAPLTVTSRHTASFRSVTLLTLLVVDIWNSTTSGCITHRVVAYSPHFSRTQSAPSSSFSEETRLRSRCRRRKSQ